MITAVRSTSSTARFVAAALFLCGPAALCVPVAAQDGVTLRGRVVDLATGEPVASAVVELPGLDRRVSTDSAGRFIVPRLAEGRTSIRSWKLGYATADTTVRIREGGEALKLGLRARPIALAPLTVRAEQGGAAAERALFDREVVPGVVGVSRQEIRDVPALAEPDVLRSLQALPGVVTLNDLSAQLHVRGGGPDQNLFLLDDARVFAPYHVFGMFGAFNPDAVGRVEFFRGGLPARYGGALSSVVQVEQRTGTDRALGVDGGLSLLGVRAAATGALRRGDTRWMLAARRSDADLVMPGDFPYAFGDAQGRVSFTPARKHRVQASFFASSDRYRMSTHESGEDLDSRWRNGVGSARWNWVGEGPWSASASAWASSYGGELTSGTGFAAPVTTNRVGVGGVRFEGVRRGQSGGLRAGVEAEAGRLDLVGDDEPGSYVEGATRGEYLMPAVYLEAERWLGRLRLAPGLRVAYDGRGGGPLVEPRLGGRLQLGEDVALTLGLGRTHQVLSTLRDDRHVMPGASLWFVHPEGTPASRTDGASAAIEGWRGRDWSFAAEGFARTFHHVPRWRPSGSRELARLEFDDGGAVGAELSVRRHTGRFTGWVAYGWSRVEMTESETGRRYAPPWDRRHGVDGALFFRPWQRLTLSARAVYGSGLPFWPFAGNVTVPRLEPLVGGVREKGFTPVWGDTQQRYPAYARADLAARYRFRVRGVELEPFANVQNVMNRANVLYYRLTGTGENDPARRRPLLVPETALPLSLLPTLGIDARF